MPDRISTRQRTAKPHEQRAHAATAPLERRFCLCRCGEPFIPRDSRQKYLPGHRYSAYESHACPECGSVHRRRANGA